MKFWKKSKTFIQKLFFKMDTEELEPMDMLAYITEELQGRYRAAKDISAQAQVFQDFLRRWEADSALDVLRKQNYEIKKGKYLPLICCKYRILNIYIFFVFHRS